MEDSRKICKFERYAEKNFRVWKARTKSALEAKEVLSVVVEDVIRDGTTTVATAIALKIAKA